MQLQRKPCQRKFCQHVAGCSSSMQALAQPLVLADALAVPFGSMLACSWSRASVLLAAACSCQVSGLSEQGVQAGRNSHFGWQLRQAGSELAADSRCAVCESALCMHVGAGTVECSVRGLPAQLDSLSSARLLAAV